SDVQGFFNPRGYTGKGQEGRGRGHDFLTLVKPRPARRVGGFIEPFRTAEFSL
ncbi:hypothetical protein GALMADRAFT_50194, partial [Galerina marginata CBS 339.88]